MRVSDARAFVLESLPDNAPDQVYVVCEVVHADDGEAAGKGDGLLEAVGGLGLCERGLDAVQVGDELKVLAAVIFDKEVAVVEGEDKVEALVADVRVVDRDLAQEGEGKGLEGFLNEFLAGRGGGEVLGAGEEAIGEDEGDRGGLALEPGSGLLELGSGGTGGGAKPGIHCFITTVEPKI